MCVCVCVCVCMCVCLYKASQLAAVKSKADEVTSQKAALDDHIATLKVTFTMSHVIRCDVVWCDDPILTCTGKLAIKSQLSLPQDPK